MFRQCEIQTVRDDIQQFETETKKPFRTAHRWDSKGNMYHYTVMPADVCARPPKPKKTKLEKMFEL